jgi:hypothetical protein
MRLNAADATRRSTPISMEVHQGMLNRTAYGIVMCTAFLGGLLAKIYVPVPDGHLYLIECSIFGAWLAADAIYRRAKFVPTLAHATAAIFLAPLVIPRWYANQPLQTGEWRKGGTESNFFTAFGVITLVFTGVSACCNLSSFGPEHGFELIINSGFSVAGVALLLGLVSKKERVFERGQNQRVQKAEESE